jgi:hypothetical protein
MRGETSQDGKISGNVQLVRGHNAHKSGGMKHAGGMEQSQSDDSGSSDHSEIQDVTAEHGPASSHTVTDNQDGTFSSQTQHADGHVHEKHGHKSLEEAHEHGKQAMNDEAPEESPDQQLMDEKKPSMGMGKVSHSGAGGY